MFQRFRIEQQTHERFTLKSRKVYVEEMLVIVHLKMYASSSFQNTTENNFASLVHGSET
jgi:hypothetical protein